MPGTTGRGIGESVFSATHSTIRLERVLTVTTAHPPTAQFSKPVAASSRRPD